MDKLSMEELGYFLYMQQMEEQQAAEAAVPAQVETEEDGED